MATHQLAIAKASFSACLLRPDPTSVSRDEIANFHSLLHLVASHCSPENIQNCKKWILCNIAHSSLRLAGLGKYLTAVSDSFTSPARAPAVTTARRDPSAKRRCLHLLYLTNDLLHHALFSTKDASVAATLQPFVVGLTGHAASFRNSPKQHRKIEELLGIWEDKHYFPIDFFEKLRETIEVAREAAESAATSDPLNRNDTGSGHKLAKSTPFIMPAMHGDQGTPWYDLPAGNLMSHIIPNSIRPINPNLVKPLRLVSGLATEELVTAVGQLLRNANKIYGATKFANQYEINFWDIDELGQPVFRMETTGEYLNVEGYYGWSKEFCDKMKMRRKRPDKSGTDNYAKAGRNDNSRSQSLSQSSSPTSRSLKRRRYSASDEDRGRRHSRSASRRGRRGYSSSRSLSGDRSGSSGRENRSHLPRRVNSKSEALERIGRAHNKPTYASPSQISGDTSRDQPYTESIRSSAQGMTGSQMYHPDFHNVHPETQTFVPRVGLEFGVGVIPIPPTLLPQHQGHWHLPPPPPPPMMPYGQQVHPGGSWPPPPPKFPSGTNQWLPGVSNSRSTTPHEGSGGGGLYRTGGHSRPDNSQQRELN